eukprot:gb/GECH01003456.1/.p1 GENE.gb/GECH01003456.1/~~gb/GECH01003456.1/.p1  ORF type:complete len:251 (+),score=44.07 gb/GECH01003456.1/:1-753(+)
MPLLQQSEQNQSSKIDVQLSIVDQASSIVGSTLLLIGLPAQIPHGYRPPAKAILIIESSFFIAGCILAILGASIAFRSRPRSVMVLCASSLSAAITYLIGCTIFLISKLISITEVPRLIFIGELISIIGSVVIALGVGFHLCADQLSIYRASPSEGTKYKFIHALLLVGGDFYLSGAVMYIIASAVHLAQPYLFETLGQILYCVGGVFFLLGASFKLSSNVMKFRSTDYDPEGYETLEKQIDKYESDRKI